MKKIYKITGCTTDVHEDSYQEGEGKFVNCWSIREHLASLELKEFDSLKDLLMEVGEKYLILPFKQDIKKVKDYWFHFDDDGLKDEIRFDNDCMVDVDNEEPSASDIREWKKGKKMLYNAHTVLYVKASYVKEATTAELEEDTKKLGIETV